MSIRKRNIAIRHDCASRPGKRGAERMYAAGVALMTLAEQSASAGVGVAASGGAAAC